MSQTIILPGALLAPTPPGVTARTRRDYRIAAAKKCGPYFEGTAAAASNAAVLADDRWPIKSQNDQEDLFTDFWLYRPDATTASDTLRVVKSGGYNSSDGELTPDLSWALAPYSGGVGERYELHGFIAPDVVNELIDETLKRCLLVVVLAAQATPDVTRHLLNPLLPWLRDSSWVRKVGWLSSNETPDTTDPFVRRLRGEVRQEGADFYLQHPQQTFTMNETLYLQVLKPAYFHCRRPSAVPPEDFGARNGLAEDGDEAVPALDWVAAGVKMLAWDRYSQALERGNQQNARDMRTEAAAEWTDLVNTYFKLPNLTLTGRLPVWGPSRGGASWGGRAW